MKSSASVEIKRGQAISFRVPSDTPNHLIKQLQKLKETERRNFSSKIAEFVMRGVSQSFTRERESITLPLPHRLSKIQRDWLKHEHSVALLGSILFQLLSNPVRATALLASLNSNTTDINEALYLQEEIVEKEHYKEVLEDEIYFHSVEETASAMDIDNLGDDLDSFDWESAKRNETITELEENEEVEKDLDSLLGDFLAKMNK